LAVRDDGTLVGLERAASLTANHPITPSSLTVRDEGDDGTLVDAPWETGSGGLRQTLDWETFRRERRHVVAF
jgi:phosphoribosylanthranilate isomerase